MKRLSTGTIIFISMMVIMFFSFWWQIEHDKKEAPKMRDYQLETFNDSTVIYDGQRKVGVIKYDKNSQLDSLINEDNQ